MIHLRLIFILLVLPIFLYSQYSLSGKVSNENGEMLTGSSVYLESTSYAAVTDAKGRFRWDSIPRGSYYLIASYLGYANDTISFIITNEDVYHDITLKGSIYNLDQIEVISNRVAGEASFTFINIPREQLRKWNTGQDMPYLLRMTPSAVVTSDAGNGVGYTGLRIRGTDATRINVTINGIPLNDAESQGVFWVNMPDLASSTSNVQIQRGVGTSTLGPGAFGGTVSINTMHTHVNPYVRATAGMGSFQTQRLIAEAGTGLMQNKYSVDVRYSILRSEGYIDRASSNLQSLYFSSSRVTEKSSTRLIAFSGREITYQSWFGTPEAKISGDNNALIEHFENNRGILYFTPSDSVNLFQSGRTYNYYQYENQVDDYRQTHLQLHDFRRINDRMLFNSSFNYTKGRGFFEEYVHEDALSRYGLDEGFSDIIRRRWLDNDFFGGNFNLHFKATQKSNYSAGISAFRYLGDHFGRIVSIPGTTITFNPSNNYYFSDAIKDDISGFIKTEHSLSSQWTLFSDLQLRNVIYTAEGDDNELIQHNINEAYWFFNPKAGIHYKINEGWSAYGSFAVAQKEPNRSDFVDHQQGSIPKPEKLFNTELGWRKEKGLWTGELTLYYMHYQDQLVLTGALNDIGSPLRTNVSTSFRRGIELSIQHTFSRKLNLQWQSSFSQNQIKDFKEVLYDYSSGFEIVEIDHGNSNISFSPGMLHTAIIQYRPSKTWEFLMLNQYVGRQYLDNTSNIKRSLAPYQTSDLLVEFRPQFDKIKQFSIKGEIRNFLNTQYASNGYSYSYIFGQLITENFLYPQAGRNFMLTIGVEF
ncbi:MAG TPA: TonB-dependent receptor [Saprospiraceae bacterium]|mgnify:CR=1 FL=1|nr:TonB-dependent receptor [Saprospiraceae bacterium]